ncbi:MAG: M81 family metallopeptidase [Planctomycetaceae bacterium]|jgi:microcystin degradation protein MlrC|nr:M81 family metallopeptidase [Planctomycetaceae bacterium]MBT6487809.1 M81 family metallopeptidase [Planctomycetaceae bacterium]MBT6495117.1 M81 family metallopeptidase [Planctomycetaceae bacterium]
MRIAIGGILHETSTCVSTQTTLNDFKYDRGILRGDDLIARFRGTNVCSGGFIEGADKFDFELVPLLRASAFPGGLIRRDDYEMLRGELIERLIAAEAAGGPVDGVLLDLHGAMVVEGIDDGDGDVIAAVREVVGPDRPIVVTQDLHGNHTRRRVEVADVLIGFDTFPHVDMAERGVEAAEIIARTVRGEIRPVMAIHQLPMFWATRCQVTAHPPMDEVIGRVHELERRDGIISVTIATGFPWADVPEVGGSVIVVADGDEKLAQSTADEFGGWVWENRERWYSAPVTVRDALADGEKTGRYPIILADHADNTGGGSPGDSTEVLRTFLEMGLEDALLLYLVDHDVATQAHAAGIGSRISVSLGGSSAPVQGPPVESEAEVVSLSDGAFAYDGPMFAGLTGSMGTSAHLRIGGTSVVVVSAREQPFDMAFARSLGIDCAAMNYICVKSAAHFRAAFEPIAGSIHNIDAAGIHTHKFDELPYRKRTRPVFPVEIAPASRTPSE